MEGFRHPGPNRSRALISQVAPLLYQALGCQVTPLCARFDARFPVHHPDPSVPANLALLQQTVRDTQADLGLAFDGDADRVGVVSQQGRVIWPDEQLMVFTPQILADHPGTTIVFDVKCSWHLPRLIQDLGGIPHMTRTGHSLLKATMLDHQAAMAGELSGHLFFRDWYGFDDGLYAGARMLSWLSRQPSSAHAFDHLPLQASTPEIKVPMEDACKPPSVTRLRNAARALFPKAQHLTIDGLRITWPYGWALMRASHTTAHLTVRMQSDTPEDLQRIQHHMTAIWKQADLPTDWIDQAARQRTS